MRPIWWVRISLALVPFAVYAQPKAELELVIRHLTNNIYVLSPTSGVVGNMLVLTGPDGVLLVDSGYAQLAPKIAAAIRKVSDAPIRFVINTHPHEDHSGANAAFAAQGAIVIAHSGTRTRLVHRAGTNTAAVPTITFDKSLSLHVNGEEVRLLHYGRGHTDGDCIVFFVQANVVHMGDYFFNFGFPFVDLGQGGSVAGYLRTISNVLATLPVNAIVVPGHGPVARIPELRRYHQLLLDTVEAAKHEIAKGRTLEEMKQSGLPAQWATRAGDTRSANFWLETIYGDTRKQ
ncbi:MAG: MBL fold metallo-hydrolase [Verrucomicrobiales bacterium]|nr:MBL fold metallo-hydrolase [Verrucomicrobiales bacterium]